MHGPVLVSVMRIQPGCLRKGEGQRRMHIKDAVTASRSPHGPDQPTAVWGGGWVLIVVNGTKNGPTVSERATTSSKASAVNVTFQPPDGFRWLRGSAKRFGRRIGAFIYGSLDDTRSPDAQSEMK